MPLVHRILYALRTLTEDEPYNPRRKHNRNRASNRGNSRRKQAVALVVTFRDLFTSGGLNLLLEDMEANRSSNTSSGDSSSSNKDQLTTGKLPAIQCSPQNTVDIRQTQFKVDLPDQDDKIGINHTKRLYVEMNDNKEETPLLLNESLSSPIDAAVLHRPPLDRSPSRLLTRVPEGRELQVLNLGRNSWYEKRKALTVSLTPDDENETVATLRKVLKWSPSKQNMTKFTVPLPRQEEHRAVAVVQNAVNRVKEEQQKRKRKLKLFKFTFC